MLDSDITDAGLFGDKDTGIEIEGPKKHQIELMEESAKYAVLRGFYDLERINKVLVDAGWGIEEHLGTLLRTISDNLGNPKITMAAQKRVEEVINKAVEYNIRMMSNRLLSESVRNVGGRSLILQAKPVGGKEESASLVKFLNEGMDEPLVDDKIITPESLILAELADGKE
jgi:hypothetical protein